MSELTQAELEEIADEMGYDAGTCFNCPGDGVIFLCSDGWICEECYRELGGVPADVGEEMHDLINIQDPRAQEWHINIQAAIDGSEDADLVGV
jgi:hypothetical protein